MPKSGVHPLYPKIIISQSDEEAIDDSMAFSIQSVASVSNMADRLHARSNEIQELNTEHSSIRRTRHESQQEILGNHERLMAKLKRCRPLPLEASIT
ncbi:unnamed protein product [Prunus armeniaca]